MTWGFIWLMLVLKIPIAMLLYIVWWAVRQAPEPEASDDDGGIGRDDPLDPRGPAFPRHRGPHGDPVLPSPPRTRIPAYARDRVPR